MGKSSSQANTTTTTKNTSTTTTTTNVGLSGADVSNIVNSFASFALADQQLNNHMINVGTTQQSTDNSTPDAHVQAIPTQTLIYIGIGLVALLFFLRH